MLNYGNCIRRLCVCVCVRVCVCVCVRACVCVCVRKRKHIRGLDTHGIFSSFLCTRKRTFFEFLCFPAQCPFWKVVYSKRKEFAPKGSKFFPFRVDHFSEGSKFFPFRVDHFSEGSKFFPFRVAHFSNRSKFLLEQTTFRREQILSF